MVIPVAGVAGKIGTVAKIAEDAGKATKLAKLAGKVVKAASKAKTAITASKIANKVKKAVINSAKVTAAVVKGTAKHFVDPKQLAKVANSTGFMGTPAIKHAADSLAAGVKAGVKEAKKLSESVKNQAKNLVNSKTISQRGMSHVFEGHVTGVPKKGTSIFNKNINVKELIRDTLTDSGSKISINTGNRSGFVFEKRYAQIIGYNGNKELHTLRVVIDEKGELVTAFPVKEYAK